MIILLCHSVRVRDLLLLIRPLFRGKSKHESITKNLKSMRNFTELNLSRLSVILLISILSACSKESASIKEVTKEIYTYSFSDPNPIPQPYKNFYPYLRFDGYSKDSVLTRWNVVEMENDYIKVHIFPEIGGKIWGAIEKSTGNEFIYNNSVVKFRNIAMRGPWTSGGIEFNFGIIGHAPHVSTPVDYITRENQDGSVSCFIGVTDLVTRARWETEINLQPGKAYFTTKTTYSNPTPVVQPYYQWSNAAYQAEGNVEFLFPGNYRIGHGGEANTWPVDEEGRDLSMYANNAFGDSKSHHIAGSSDGFYGAYWHDLDFGSGHYATHGEKLGKKIFLWSQARSGGIWEDLLTDEDGQYIELQSGRLFNQASTGSTRTPFKHFGFSPYTSDVFNEYWFPIMDIGGVLKANNVGALNIVRNEENQNIYFSPLETVKGEIKIYYGEDLKYSFSIDNKPLEVWQQTVSLNTPDEPLRVVVGNGELIYEETNKESITSRPMVAPDDFNWESLFGLYTDGMNWVYQGRYDRAFHSLSACLEIDSLYAPALNSIAELFIRKGDLQCALNCVRKSLSINTYDAKANFIYGLINRRDGNNIDAQDGFSVAAISSEYYIPANIELSKLFIANDNPFIAEMSIDKVLSKDINNQEALLLKSYLLRKTGDTKESNRLLDKVEKISPLNHFSRAERFLSKDNRKTINDFTSLIRNEVSHETYIDIALWYEYLGDERAAIKILELSPENALADLQLSYMYSLIDNKEEAESYFEKFIQADIDYVLPFRPETLEVMEWAVNKTGSWKPKYYLGLLHWSMGNRAEARELFNSCANLPDSPYFYLAKADLFSGDENYDKEADLTKALKLKADEWRSYTALINFYLSENRTDKALEISNDAVKLFPENDEIKYSNAQCLLSNGMYSECLEVLENTVILPYEGSQNGRTTYRLAAIMESLQFYKEAKLKQALESVEKAKLWPENLGVGKPYETDERIELFLEAEYLMKSNQRDRANELFSEIISYTEQNQRRYSSTDYIYLLSLKRLGMNARVNEFLSNWEQSYSGSTMLKWVRAMNNNNRSLARSIEQEISTTTGGTPWDPRYSDTNFEIVKNISEIITGNV